MPRTIAIMQPYFFPYAGYFRLLEQADHFVIYDCVQFPRRGYVHRNQLPRRLAVDGERAWLSLPLKKLPRDTVIADLEFSDDAAGRWAERLSSFECFRDLSARDPYLDAVLHKVAPGANVCSYLCETLSLACRRLGIKTPVSRSSELSLPPDVLGQDRIIAIAKHHGAETYLNAPGGRALYDPEKFAQVGMNLQFLPDFIGPTHSILFDLSYKTTQPESRTSD